MERGTVVLVELDPTVGHEQRGVRPCIAVSDPSVNIDQRFPLIAVVPVTGTPGEGALYPELSPGNSDRYSSGSSTRHKTVCRGSGEWVRW